MKTFFDELENILFEKDPKHKIELFWPFYRDFCANTLSFSTENQPKVQKKPSFAEFCSVVEPEKLYTRMKLDSDEGKARFVHSILHIEYCAIDLGLDHAYRFRGLPIEYYADWIEVAREEIEHFYMLEEILKSLGYEYGDFEVHQALFDAMMSTLTLRSRMAVVPRYLEANGLDANVKMMQKLQGVGDKVSKTIVKALQVILDEEISHVQKGDKWFAFACMQDGVDKNVYFDDVTSVMPKAWRQRGYVNEAARLEAGFNIDEIERIKVGAR